MVVICLQDYQKRYFNVVLIRKNVSEHERDWNFTLRTQVSGIIFIRYAQSLDWKVNSVGESKTKGPGLSTSVKITCA